MYTSYIGRRFLDLWNQRTGRQLTAQQFFDAELHPVFFAHDKYLQWVPNSPFAQKVAQKDLVPGKTAEQVQLEKLHRNVRELAPDASFVIGFPAAGTAGTTSGQVSGVGPRVTAEDVYCSWIGGALGVGVSGGLVLLLDEEEVLWALYEGWAHYRAYLSQRPGLKGNQIDTWNGRWLTHAFDEEAFQLQNPTANFDFDAALDTKDGASAVSTQAWVKVLFALAEKYQRRLTAYVYSLAQMNRTIGFVPLALDDVRSRYQLAMRLFGQTALIRDWKQLANLYETHYSFARACQLGSIGLAALEPAKLRDYLPDGEKSRHPALKTDADRLQFELYQLWILAMLNNQELYNAADRLATALHSFSGRNSHRDSGRGKKNLDRQVENVFVKHRPLFIERLREMLEEANAAPEFRDPFDGAVRQVMLMPVDNFPLFIILTRFRYVAQSSPVEPAASASTVSNSPTLFS